MKILLVHNKYQVRGGEDSVVENETKMLRDHGHEVIEYIRDNSEINIVKGIGKLLIPFKSIYNTSAYCDVKKILLCEHVDIVHIHNTHMVISPSVIYAARKCKVPVVMTLHNFRLLCAGAMLYRGGHICEDCVGGCLWKGVKYGCFRNSKIQSLAIVLSDYFHRLTGIYKYVNFICLSEFNKEKLLTLKQVCVDKVFVKPNFGVKPDLELNIENTVTNNSDLEMINNDVIENEQSELQDRDIYLYFGRMDETKGVKLIIDAFSEMPDKKLAMAGNGPLLEECQKMVADKGLRNIEILGWCDKEKLTELFSRTKAVICASQWYEGHPMVVVESFANGIPVITGDLGNIGTTVTDGYNGIKYKYDSKDALRDAVVLFEANDRTELSENAKKTFEDKYTEEMNYKLLIDIYDSIIN